MERAVLTGCGVAVGATECLRDRWRARFPGLPPEHFQALPVGYDEADFEGVEPERPGRWTLVHVGSLYLDRSAGPFLEGLATYLVAHPSERGRISVVFLGAKDEANKEAFRAAVETLGLGEVVQDRGFRSHRESVAVVTGAHALLYLGGDPPEGDLNVQSKVFEYLRAARPVLAVSRDVEATRLLARAPALLRVERGDADGVRRALERLREAPPQEPEPGAAREFEAAPLAARLAGWIRGTVEAASRGRSDAPGGTS
jgi:hypothetical protein